jgi:hypothetical protein
MKIRTLIQSGVTSALLAACATAPAPPAPEPEPVYLSYSDFKVRVNEAYIVSDYDLREKAFVELLARTDLRQDDRAETYLMRGLIRGVYVSAGPHAGPYCAVEDYAKFDELASPEHPRRPQMLDDREYQLSRYQYFQKPESCE